MDTIGGEFGCAQLCHVAMEIDQRLLDALPPSQRQRIMRRLRLEQLRSYHEREGPISPVACHPPLSASLRLTPPLQNLPSAPRREGQGQRRRNHGCKARFGSVEEMEDAIARHDDEEVLRLLAHGLDPNSRSFSGASLLHLCAQHDSVQAAEWLYSRGATPDILDGDLSTPLHIASARGNTDMLLLLLAAGSDPCFPDCDNRLPLDVAPPGSEAQALLLLQLQRHGFGENELRESREGREKEMLRHAQGLIHSGSSLNTRDHRGVAMLHTAAVFGYLSVSRLLLDNGADPSLEDTAGNTPLHLAARFGQAQTAQLLLRHGANPNVSNHKQQSPSDLASSMFIQDVIWQGAADWAKRWTETGTGKVATVAEDQPYEQILHDEFVPAKRHPLAPPMGWLDRQGERTWMFGDIRTTRERGARDEDKRNSASHSNGNFPIEQVRLKPPSPSDDLASLTELTEKFVCYELQKRFQRDQIYTYIGEILLVLNPFRQLPIYSAVISHLYHSESGKFWSTLSPHVFACAERAYHMMRRDQRPQVFVVSGESGSGKTEACRHLIHHLLLRSQFSSSGLPAKLSHAQTVLRLLSTARVEHNPHSSRCALLTRLVFSRVTGCLLGAHLKAYVLERCRLTRPPPGQSTFALFSPTGTKAKDHELAEGSCFCSPSEGEGGGLCSDRTGFSSFLAALQGVGLIDADVEDVTSALGGAMRLLALPLACVDGEGTAVPNMGHLHTVARKLMLCPTGLVDALTTRRRCITGEWLASPLCLSDARRSRDLLAQALYFRVFSHLVNTMNTLLQPTHDSDLLTDIGILDMPGLQNFQQNTFEQLCLNLMAERLLQFSRDAIFTIEQAECWQEGVAQDTSPPPGNDFLIEYFFQAPHGFLSLLDDACRSEMPSEESDVTLLQKLCLPLHSSTSSLDLPMETHDGNGNAPGGAFIVHHFGGPVTYDLRGIVRSNRVSLPPHVLSIMKVSKNPLIAHLFCARLSTTGEVTPPPTFRAPLHLWPPPTHTSHSTSLPWHSTSKLLVNNFHLGGHLRSSDLSTQRLSGSKEPQDMGDRAALLRMLSERRDITLASQLRHSLEDIQSRLQRCTSHFLFCIKPNQDAVPSIFDPEVVCAQLQALSVVAMAKQRLHGYAVRLSFREFLDRYVELRHAAWPTTASRKEVDICQDILRYCRLRDWKVGRTRVLLKHWQAEQLSAACLLVGRRVTRCQKAVRAFLRGRRSRRAMSAQGHEARLASEFFSQVEDMGLSVYDALVIQNASDIAREHDRQRSESAHLFYRQKAQWHLSPQGSLPRRLNVSVTRNQRPCLSKQAAFDPAFPWSSFPSRSPPSLNGTVTQLLKHEGSGEIVTKQQSSPQRRSSDCPRYRPDHHSDDANISDSLLPRKHGPPLKPRRDPGTRLSQSAEAVGRDGPPYEPPDSEGAGSPTALGRPRPHSDEFVAGVPKRPPPPKPKRHPHTRLSNSDDDAQCVRCDRVGRGRDEERTPPASPSEEEPVYTEMLSVLAAVSQPTSEVGDGVYEEMRFSTTDVVARGNYYTDSESGLGDQNGIPAPFPDLPTYRPPLLVLPSAAAPSSPNSDESPLTPIDLATLPSIETGPRSTTLPDSSSPPGGLVEGRPEPAGAAAPLTSSVPPTSRHHGPWATIATSHLYRTQSAHSRIGAEGGKKPPLPISGLSHTLGGQGFPTMPRLRSLDAAPGKVGVSLGNVSEKPALAPGFTGRRVCVGRVAAMEETERKMGKMEKSSSLPAMDPPTRPPPFLRTLPGRARAQTDVSPASRPSVQRPGPIGRDSSHEGRTVDPWKDRSADSRGCADTTRRGL
uniref:unconventional myosin-XVI-like isoform X2 n=1 Tax=Myxine glutinosa TaxID=7769 RepID=UPI00358FA231